LSLLSSKTSTIVVWKRLRNSPCALIGCSKPRGGEKTWKKKIGKKKTQARKAKKNGKKKNGKRPNT